MPPRTPKKRPPGPGTRRGGRGRRGVRAQAQVQPEVEEPMKAEDAQVNEVAEEKASPPAKTTKEQSVEKKDDDLKESIDEFEKSERLDLEDNDPEYEPEEYAISVDYGEKEIEPEEAREEGDEIEDEEEEEEEDPVEEEESDMIGEEVEDLREELEGEEDNDGHELRGEIVEHDEDVDHHELVKERRKRKEFEVFVGGLDKDATEDDLRKVFGKVGDVVEVTLMMNPQTKKNKGFAFLRFATIEQAKRACSDLKNPVVHGKPCGVTPSQDSDTLFLGNICRSWTKEALRDKLRHYAIDNIEDLTLVEDSNSIGMNRGFAFLEFSSRPEAMDAFKRLQKRDVFFGVDRPAKVSFADSFIDPGDEIMAQVKTVFVDGLLVSWDEDQLRGLLKKYGEVEKVELARNMPSAKRKDFGFVTFDTHEAAVTCAKSINNEELGEGDRKAKVRARLSRPLQRGKGKNVGRGEFRAGHGPSHGSVHGLRTPWSRTIAHSIPVRGARGVPPRVPPTIDRGLKRPSSSYRDRRPIMAVPPRSRPPPPPPRSYERRPPVASYPKSSMKRDYGRHEELPPPRSRASIDYSSRAPPPRSRASIDYSSRAPPDRRASFRDDYSSRESGYPDLPRVPSRPVVRRDYVDDAYAPRYERPPPAYREARGHEYEPVSGSKRPYSSMDDVPPRYADAGPRQSRARMDYELSGSASYYGNDYGNRPGRSNLGYVSGRSTIPSQDSSPLYGGRQGMSYGGGSYSGSDGGGMYSSGFGGDYMHRDSDGGGSSYSSTYPGRGNGWWVDGHGR